MEIPCDTIGQAVAGYLDASDFTAASRTAYRRVLTGMARALGPGRAVAELDAGELTAWFARDRGAHGPATWNRDWVIVRSFVRHLQRQGAAVELPRSSTGASGPTSPVGNSGAESHASDQRRVRLAPILAR
jgi:hypothetical protein